jgi:AcrR family transcriptional regulator
MFDVALVMAENGVIMDTETATETPSTRQRILQIALELMSKRGVDGTSMRDLATACDLNVASLYHYFPSKRELLEAVLVEHGLFPVRARKPKPEDDQSDDALVALMADILTSMFEIEDFVRLMVGEAMRGEVTARAVGLDLFSTFESAIEDWITKNRADLEERDSASAVARLLTGVIVGLFVQQAAGVVAVEGDDLDAMIWQRARETANILRSFA